MKGPQYGIINMVLCRIHLHHSLFMQKVFYMFVGVPWVHEAKKGYSDSQQNRNSLLELRMSLVLTENKLMHRNM